MGLRKKYVTKNEAIKFLYTLKERPILDMDDCRTLEMIRICLIGEEKGFELWGKPIEETRPVFIQSTDETRSAYEKDLAKAMKIAKGEA